MPKKKLLTKHRIQGITLIIAVIMFWLSNNNVVKIIASIIVLLNALMEIFS